MLWYGIWRSSWPSFRVCAAELSQLLRGRAQGEFVLLGPKKIAMQGIGGVDPDPAVHVLGGGGDSGAGLGGPELRDACRPVRGTSLCDQPGRMPGGPPDRLGVDESVGHPLLHGLEAADRAAELLTPGGVFGS